jgi:hypothetical protein
MAHEGVPLVVIQRQLGHANLGITSIYLQGIDNAESINAVRSRHAPMIPASAELPRPRWCQRAGATDHAGHVSGFEARVVVVVGVGLCGADADTLRRCC